MIEIKHLPNQNMPWTLDLMEHATRVEHAEILGEGLYCIEDTSTSPDEYLGKFRDFVATYKHRFTMYRDDKTKIKNKRGVKNTKTIATSSYGNGKMNPWMRPLKTLDSRLPLLSQASIQRNHPKRFKVKTHSLTSLKNSLTEMTSLIGLDSLFE